MDVYHLDLRHCVVQHETPPWGSEDGDKGDCRGLQWTPTEEEDRVACGLAPGLGPGAQCSGDGGPSEGLCKQARAFVWPGGGTEDSRQLFCLAKPSCKLYSTT